MADQVLTKGSLILFEFDQSPLFQQMIVQRRGPGRHVGHRIVIPLASLRDPVCRGPTRLEHVVIRPVWLDRLEPFEVFRVVALAVNNQFLLFDLNFRNRLDLRRLGPVNHFRFRILQGHVLRFFLLDPGFEFLSLHLQDFHRLDHPRSQLHLLAHLLTHSHLL